jgi:hypothetical protein
MLMTDLAVPINQEYPHFPVREKDKRQPFKVQTDKWRIKIKGSQENMW